MHGARKDVSTGYVLRGWTCFLEELARDRVPRTVIIRLVKLRS